MSDIIGQLSEMLANAQDFAKNHGVTSIQTYFDFIPDEIITEIFTYMMENLEITLVCRRFNDIYISLIKTKPKSALMPLLRISDWEDKIESFGILSQREIGLMFYFQSQILIQYQSINNTTVLECNRDQMYYFYLNDNIFYMKKRCKIYSNELFKDDHNLQFETVTSENDRYLYSKNNKYGPKSVHYKTYRSKHSTCIINKKLVTVISGDTVLSERKKYFKATVYNGIKYYFPKEGYCSKYIKEILTGDHSPYPITVMGNLSIEEPTINKADQLSVDEFLDGIIDF
ncbi:hypothetical protein PV-S19_0180 [Pacmanvirus S19]|nr:hypothetical protein PV-S19_0180 [Pacmanvirus S19]